MIESLPDIDAALRGMVVGLLALTAGRMRRDLPRWRTTQVGALLALGLVVQIISSTPAFEANVSAAVQSPWVGISVANSVLFWWFVQALFDDDFRWRPWQGAVWGLAFATGMFGCAMFTGTPAPVSAALRVLMRAVPVVGALLALHAAARHWRDDLVERRRRLRFFVLATGVTYMLVQLSMRLAAPEGRLSRVSALVDVFGLLVIAAGVAWRLLRVAPGETLAAPTAAFIRADAAAAPSRTPAAVEAEPRPPAPDAAEMRLADALDSLMRRDRLYRAENLTIGALAARLSVPEYRLRRHINQRLGHRNFNAYVNGMRLEEATAALADPGQRHLPVLTIALTAGFQSIGPFNRAFKAATGATPTEFRKENIAES